MSKETIFKLHIQGPAGERDFIVPLGISQIGRQEGNHILLVDNQVSRQHARLECTQSECFLVDLGSSNGTYLNEEKVQPNSPVLLKDGDQIKIGPFQLTYSQEAIEAIPEDVSPIRIEDFPSPPKQDEKLEKKSESRKTPAGGKIPPPPVEAPPASSTLQPDFFLSPENLHSRKLLQFLPGIYHTDFMSRLLGLFESILLPIEWTVDNFDLFLSPATAPSGFLPWLENWFALPPASQWNEQQKRSFLCEAQDIYARRGTRWALSRLLEIHCGCQAKITDTGEKLEPFTFIIELPLRKGQVDLETLSALIDSNKPAYTMYRLEFSQS